MSSYRDDDFSSSVSAFDIAKGRGGLPQRVGLADDRLQLYGLNKLRKHDQGFPMRDRGIPAKVLARKR